ARAAGLGPAADAVAPARAGWRGVRRNLSRLGAPRADVHARVGLRLGQAVPAALCPPPARAYRRIARRGGVRLALLPLRVPDHSQRSRSAALRLRRDPAAALPRR